MGAVVQRLEKLAQAREALRFGDGIQGGQVRRLDQIEKAQAGSMHLVREIQLIHQPVQDLLEVGEH